MPLQSGRRGAASDLTVRPPRPQLQHDIRIRGPGVRRWAIKHPMRRIGPGRFDYLPPIPVHESHFIATPFVHAPVLSELKTGSSPQIKLAFPHFKKMRRTRRMRVAPTSCSTLTISPPRRKQSAAQPQPALRTGRPASIASQSTRNSFQFMTIHENEIRPSAEVHEAGPTYPRPIGSSIYGTPNQLKQRAPNRHACRGFRVTKPTSGRICIQRISSDSPPRIRRFETNIDCI